MEKIINSVRLTGRLGQDPDVKSLSNGKKLVKLSIAINEMYHNAKGEKVSETQWHNLVAWNKQADEAAELHKGEEISIEGRLVSRSYTGKDGVRKYVTEVVINTLERTEAKMPVTESAES